MFAIVERSERGAQTVERIGQSAVVQREEMDYALYLSIFFSCHFISHVMNVKR